MGNCQRHKWLYFIVKWLPVTKDNYCKSKNCLILKHFFTCQLSCRTENVRDWITLSRSVFLARSEFVSGPKLIQIVLFTKRENRCPPAACKNVITVSRRKLVFDSNCWRFKLGPWPCACLSWESHLCLLLILKCRP